MAGHIHAELMAQYAEDAKTTDSPWLRWQSDTGFGWDSLIKHPTWNKDTAYRRKPRTITINGREVPEPMRVAPEIGSTIYLSAISNVEKFYRDTWNASIHKFDLLSRGIVHASDANAVAMTEALLSFTEQGGE